MTQDFHNGEDRAEDAERRADAASEWPVHDLMSSDAPAQPVFAADDSDAPVSFQEDGEPLEGAPQAEGTDEQPERTLADVLDEAEEDEHDEFDEPDDRPGAPFAFTESMESEESDDHVDIRSGGARDIDATTVSITQGGARDVEATTVTINQGGAARITADEVTISQGGVGLARTERLTIEQGGSAFAVMADNAELNADTSVFLLVAGSTSGDVRPFLDWRAAAAFGAGFALVLTLLRRGRR